MRWSDCVTVSRAKDQGLNAIIFLKKIFRFEYLFQPHNFIIILLISINKTLYPQKDLKIFQCGKIAHVRGQGLNDECQ